MQADITLDNIDETVTSLSGAVRGAATSRSEQTTSNLAITAAVFMRVAELINTATIIQDEVYILSCLVCNNGFNFSSPCPLIQTAQDLVSILGSLQEWNTDVLRTNASK